MFRIGFPSGLAGKESTCNARDTGKVEFDPWVGKIPLEKEMATHSGMFAWEIQIPWTEHPGRLVHGATRSQTRLST